MTTSSRTRPDASRVLSELEARIGRLERRGRGFQIPAVEENGGVIASPEPPPAPSDPGTLWIDTDDGNRIYRWDGAAWVPTMDPAVDLDRNAAATALASWQDTEATSDGQVTTWFQSAAPAGASEGDLWVDSDDNQLYRWDGAAWASQGDTALGELLSRQSLASTVADGQVLSWWQFGEPVPSGFGDLWVKTSDDPPTLYRWNNFDWVQVLDWSVLSVQSALDNKITSYYQPAPPVSQAPGDLWFDTSDANHPYRAESSGATAVAAGEWVSAQDGVGPEAKAIAQVKNTVYRQVSKPWADGAAGHSGDVGDLWYDTSPGPGSGWELVEKEISGGVGTVTTADAHDVLVGQEAAVIGLDEALNGVHTVTAVTAMTVSFAIAEADLGPEEIPQGIGAVVQAQGVGEPANRVFIWDGTAWSDARDTEVMDTASTLSNAVTGQSDQLSNAQADITALQEQADDLALTAYAADGRISISDYEPLPADAADKNEGSLWLTRTRDRANFVVNPSFETDAVTSWAADGAGISRVAVAGGAPDSAYAARLANDGTTASPHVLRSDPRYPAEPGQNVVLSGYATLESGIGTGYRAVISFHDIAGEPIAGGEFVGADIDLPADGTWPRLYASGEAPDGTDSVELRFEAPASAGTDVWLVDAVLGEFTDKLGRYFDGGSKGGSWNGSPELSASNLDGGAVIRLFDLADGAWVEKYWTADTISSVAAETIIGGDTYERPPDLQPYTMDGALVADGSLAVDKNHAFHVTASEALAPGDLVNVWDNDGLFMARKATAGTANQVYNPSFELGTAGWDAGDDVNLSAVTDPDGDTSDYDGSLVASVSPSGVNPPGGASGLLIAQTSEALVPVEAGDLVSATGRVRDAGGSAPAGVRLTLLGFDEAGALVGTVGSTDVETLSEDTPKPYNRGVIDGVTVPAGVTHVCLTWHRADGDDGTSWVDGALYFDAHTVTRGRLIEEYFSQEAPVVRRADGFVLDTAGIGDAVPVYHQGYNELVGTTMLPGGIFLSTVPGEAATSPPQGVGTVIQAVGFAPNSWSLNFSTGPVVRIV